MAMDRLFTLMQEKSASDMFLSANAPIHLKINGNMVPINQQKMDLAYIMSLLAEVVPATRLVELEKENELNMAIPVAGIGSFRLSAFRQRGSISAVFRHIPFHIPELSSLGLPPIVSDLILQKRGLMLVVGSTGSGKSTTIASLLNHRNRTQSGHILTLEDPIEFLFKNQRSIINQREIGSDSVDLPTALRNALRQAPDCIVIGEIRDKETMSAALAYAQSGHLVVSTLHANNTYRALSRIIGFFPREVRSALLQDLASTITAIVSQRLINAVDGGRRAAVEVMLNTRHIAELIEQDDLSGIREAIEHSMAPGSQTFEQALLQLIKDGVITKDEALANADSPTNLYWLLNNQNSEKQKPQEPPQQPTDGATFTEFTLNV